MKYLLLIFFVCTGTVLADVYKWTDEAGHTHFSDKPHELEKAEKIILKVDKPKTTTTATLKQEVIMYATSWCGYCKKAREHFAKNNIPYTEYNIETDAEAKRKYDSFGGKGVPVIFIGEERMDGFNVAKFSEIYH
jgi:glutaredoxin